VSHIKALLSEKDSSGIMVVGFFVNHQVFIISLVMASPWFRAIKSKSASRFLLILPMLGLEVKGIGPSVPEVLVRSREQEPARTTNRTAIAARFRQNLDTSL